MAKFKESFAVLGLSRFGYRMATGLYAAGASVIAVDKDEVVVQRIAQHVTKAIEADAVDLAVLAHVGVFEADTVVIGFRSAFDAAVLLAHHIRSEHPRQRIIAQVDTEPKGAALRALGVQEIVLPEIDIADRWVRRLAQPDIVDRIPLGTDAEIIEMEVPARFVGRSPRSLQIRQEYGVYVLATKRKAASDAEAEVRVTGNPDVPFEAGTTMLIVGASDRLERFAREIQRG